MRNCVKGGEIALCDDGMESLGVIHRVVWKRLPLITMIRYVLQSITIMSCSSHREMSDPWEGIVFTKTRL